MQLGKSVVCTVFEGEYHYGVAGLVNSLYAHGFRGLVYAAYRGDLPPWAQGKDTTGGSTTVVQVTNDLVVRFEAQDTAEVLSNIKPQVIEQVWDKFGDQIDNVFYFDCDIVIKTGWEHFENWAKFGVALCEDMNSPIATTHPIRMKWRDYYNKFGVDYEPKDDVYVNGGFVGINKQFRGFSSLWAEMQEHMFESTGRNNRFGTTDRWNMFKFMDQDALNVAKDITPSISVMGKQAMDFGKFGYVMSHAAGRVKPWRKSFVISVITTGSRPTMADKAYWNNVSGPVKLYSSSKVLRKRAMIKMAILLGRLFTKT